MPKSRRLHANRTAFSALFVTLDDGGAFGLNVDEATAIYKWFFKKLAERRLSCNANKTLLYQKEIPLLGHILCVAAEHDKTYAARRLLYRRSGGCAGQEEAEERTTCELGIAPGCTRLARDTSA